MGAVGTLITFSPSTTIVSDDVDSNFADLKAAINTAVFTDETNLITAEQKFDNDVWLSGRNATDTADVHMWKINTTGTLFTDSVIRCATIEPQTDSTYNLGGTSQRWLRIWADSIVLTTQTPASASASGEAGQIAWDTGFLYVCVGTDEWERVAIATW